MPTRSRAQVDIESLRPEDVPPGLSGAVRADLDVQTGNIELVELAGNLRVNWLRPSATALLIADGGLGLLGGERYASSGLLHLRDTYWLDERIGVEGFGQLNYDRALLVDFRSLLGAGLRVRIAQGTWGAAGAGLSLMWEVERLDLDANAVHPNRTETLRNSAFVTLRLVSGSGLVVTSTTYLQQALGNIFGDLRAIENLGVSASITDRLALTVTFNLRYDSDPPDGIAALDTRLRTGLAFTY